MRHPEIPSLAPPAPESPPCFRPFGVFRRRPASPRGSASLHLGQHIQQERKRSHGDGKDIRRGRGRAAALQGLGRLRRLQGRRRSGRRQAGYQALQHHDPAAQCHRFAAHGPCLQQHAAGHPGALETDAGLRHALAARHRPCRHRHADGDGTRHGRARRTDAARNGSRRLCAARLGTEDQVARHDHRTAEASGRFARLVARGLYHVRRARSARRARTAISTTPSSRSLSTCTTRA